MEINHNSTQISGLLLSNNLHTKREEESDSSCKLLDLSVRPRTTSSAFSMEQQQDVASVVDDKPRTIQKGSGLNLFPAVPITSHTNQMAMMGHPVTPQITSPVGQTDKKLEVSPGHNLPILPQKEQVTVPSSTILHRPYLISPSKTQKPIAVPSSEILHRPYLTNIPKKPTTVPINRTWYPSSQGKSFPVSLNDFKTLAANTPLKPPGQPQQDATIPLANSGAKDMFRLSHIEKPQLEQQHQNPKQIIKPVPASNGTLPNARQTPPCDKGEDNSLRISRQQKGETVRKKYSCKDCKYHTNRISNLKIHVSGLHEKEYNVTCCRITFKTKAEYNLHRSRSHKDGYRCDRAGCGLWFAKRTFLDRHDKVHSGERMFCCKICEYSSYSKSNVKRHQKVHQTSGSKNPQEQQCTPYQKKEYLFREHEDPYRQPKDLHQQRQHPYHKHKDLPQEQQDPHLEQQSHHLDQQSPHREQLKYHECYRKLEQLEQLQQLHHHHRQEGQNLREEFEHDKQTQKHIGEVGPLKATPTNSDSNLGFEFDFLLKL